MEADTGEPGIAAEFDSNELAQTLFGEHNSNLRLLELIFPVHIQTVGSTAFIKGKKEDVSLMRHLLYSLYKLQKVGYKVTSLDVEMAGKIIKDDPQASLKDIFLEHVYVSRKRKTITPKTINQKKYIDAVKKNDIVFGIGPAGTGKTYLAIAMAVAALQRDEVDKIILTRPAVEAGEKLGFLPGDLFEKVNPYLRPLYDALHDMLENEKVKEMFENDIIEVAPLAFMRGRTLSDSFVILDEAQNSTSEQMKMFLTRLGLNSKAIVTGDVTQIDLPAGKISGLVEGKDILKNIKGISFTQFTDKDVVRHSLVQDIVNAYESVKPSRGN